MAAAGLSLYDTLAAIKDGLPFPAALLKAAFPPHCPRMTAAAEKSLEPSALAQLDARARDIFKRIVNSYLASGEPVGSRMLSRQLPVALSPASVRNVMQDLEELGLVYAPHTSAGRLPTQRGLRFYVDALLEFGTLAREERARIEAQARDAAEEGGYESALARTTSLISDLAHGAGVVLSSKDDAKLRQIEFVRLDPERALAVLVAEDGSVENRVVAITPDFSAATLAEAANYFNAHARGKIAQRKRGRISSARARLRAARSTRSRRDSSTRALPLGRAAGGANN